MKKQLPAYPYAVWCLLFTIVPMLLMVGFAIIDKTDRGIVLNFENILRCFDPLYLKIILFSFKIAFISTLLCLLLGYPAALILSGSSFKHKNILLFLLIAPMWMNFLLRTYAWLTLLETNGVVNTILGFFGLGPFQMLYTEGAVIMGMVYNFLPFMILPIYTVLIKMDRSILEAAEDLGSGKTNIFRRIIVPMSMPGVFSGIIMVFMPAVTTFVITRLLGGGKFQMIGNVIEQQFIVANDWGFGSALSMLLMFLILLLIGITNYFDLDIGEGGLL